MTPVQLDLARRAVADDQNHSYYMAGATEAEALIAALEAAP